MAKDKFEVGDEVQINATVTAVWPDGHVTIQIAGAGHKVTMRGDTGNIAPADGAPAKLSGNPSGLGPAWSAACGT